MLHFILICKYDPLSIDSILIVCMLIVALYATRYLIERNNSAVTDPETIIKILHYA